MQHKFGKELRRLRRQAGYDFLRLIEFSRRVGFNLPYVLSVEQGTQEPSEQYLKRFAKLTGSNGDDLANKSRQSWHSA